MTVNGSILNAGYVLDYTATPPGSGTDGNRYIVMSGATGAWAGFDNYIARYNSAVPAPHWEFDFPVAGLEQYVASTPAVLAWRSQLGVSGSVSGWDKPDAVRSASYPYVSLANLDAAATTAGVPLELNTGFTTTLGTDTTLNAPVVRFCGGIVALGAHKLTLNAIEAANIQCFTGNGNVVINAGAAANVTWFGAVSDAVLGTAGGTDNTAAFNAAIVCASSSGKGGEVYVPPGVYDFSTISTTTPSDIAVYTNAHRGLTIRGAGRRASILQSSLAATQTLLAIGDSTSTQGVNLVDVGFASSATAGMMTAGEALLVQLYFCVDAKVERCSFLGGYTMQLQVVRPQGVQILDSDFHGTDNSGSVTSYCTPFGIEFIRDQVNNGGGQASRIQNCTIRDFRTSNHTAIAVKFDVYNSGGTLYGPGSEFAIVDCDIENSDLSIDDNIGNNRFTRNSMESGELLIIATPAHNTGAGTIALASPALNATAQAGAYRIVCEDQVAQTFTVYDPTNYILGTATPGVAFTTEINFTITNGTPPFALWDKFILEVFNPATATYTLANTNNTGGGTIDVEYTPFGGSPQNVTNRGRTDTVGINGVFFLAYDAVNGNFIVYDPMGNSLGVVTPGMPGTPFTLPSTSTDSWTVSITTGGAAFAAGDSFTIVAFGDVLFRVGNGYVTEYSLYAQNTLEMDGVQNGKFFELVSYRFLQISDNVFSNENGYHIYCGSDNDGYASQLHNNTGLDPRAGMYLRAGLQDGTWIVKDNIERVVGNQSVVAPAGAATPLVANVETLLMENTTATTITNFVNGHNGQELTVLAFEPTPSTSLQSNSKIMMMSGATEQMLSGVPYQFRASIPAFGGTPVWFQTAPYTPAPTPQSETTLYLNAGITNGAAAGPAWFNNAVDRLIIALKGYGLFSGVFDALWLFAVNDLLLAEINLITPASYKMTWPNGITFKAYNSVTGNGTNQYGDPAMTRNALTNYMQNTASLSVWTASTVAANTYAIGDSASNVARLAPYIGTSKVRGSVNDTGLQAALVAADPGLASAVRSSGTARAVYRNGVSVGSSNTINSSATAADHLYLLREVSVYHSQPVSMAAIGAKLTDAQEAQFFDAMLPFMRLMGVSG